MASTVSVTVPAEVLARRALMQGGTGAVVVLLGCQSKLIYYPNPYPAKQLRDFAGRGGRELRFTTPGGTQVAHWLPPMAGSPGGRLWIVCAGNGSLALDWVDICAKADRSAGWLFVDYPGYGECQGKPAPDTIRANIVGAVGALAAELGTSRAALEPRLAAFGHSLGAAAALIAAEEFQLKRLVLLSPFTSMTEMGKIVLGRPLCYLNLHRYDNRARLRAIAPLGPQIDLFHGTADDSIPLRMSEELAATWPQSITLHRVSGGGHNDLPNLAESRIQAALNRRE